MQARINNQSRTSERVVIETAELGIGVGIKADFARKALAVQGPSLVEGIEVEVATEGENGLSLGRQSRVCA